MDHGRLLCSSCKHSYLSCTACPLDKTTRSDCVPAQNQNPESKSPDSDGLYQSLQTVKSNARCERDRADGVQYVRDVCLTLAAFLAALPAVAEPLLGPEAGLVSAMAAAHDELAPQMQAALSRASHAEQHIVVEARLQSGFPNIGRRGKSEGPGVKVRVLTRESSAERGCVLQVIAGSLARKADLRLATRTSPFRPGTLALQLCLHRYCQQGCSLC
jgi:hypothetical protein